MTTRRNFLRLAGETATLAFLSGQPTIAEDNPSQARTRNTQRATPLLNLQQRFVDLRFGMFLHFNMATFQDREWGDPTSSPDLFNLSVLGTCFTKQTGDMVYTMAENSWLSQLWLDA